MNRNVRVADNRWTIFCALLPLAVAGALPATAGAVVGASGLTRLPPEGATREERFANPPGSCRLLTIRHTVPDDSARHDGELAYLTRRGFGGFATEVSFHGIDGNGPTYVDAESRWPTLRHALKRAKESNLTVWLYDEAGYPSGSARDLTLKGHPELESTGYLIARARAKGGETVTLDMPPGAFRVAWACQMNADRKLWKMKNISDWVRRGRIGTPPEEFANARIRPRDAAGRSPAGFDNWRTRPWIASFTYEVPTGDSEWMILAVSEDWVYEGTQAECKGMKSKFRYPNPLVAAATERFLDVNHGAYARHLGDDLGRYFVSTFTDEPHVMATFWRRMPYGVLPSSPELAALYERRTGRRLLDDIPYLVEREAVNDEAAGRRIAFWGLVGELFAENFLGKISTWCRAHGFLSGGHLMGETDFCYHVSHYGDFFRAMRRFDAPSIDCLTSEPPSVKWWEALYAGSARELNGSKYAMCEVSNHVQANRKPKYVVSDEEVRGTLHRLLWGGINTFTSYYSLNDRDDRRMRRINLELGRLNVLLRDGFSVADVAILYPIEDAQATYGPLSAYAAIHKLEHDFYAAATALYEDARPFLFVDSPGILASRIEGRELVHGKLRWRAIVTTGVRHSPAVKAKLAAFAAAGGTVIACQPGKEAEMLKTINDSFEKHVTVAWDGAAHPIRAMHRRTDQGDVFYVMNDSPQPWKGSVRLCADASGAAVLWNSEEGTHGPAVRDRTGAYELDLSEYGAAVLTTATALNPRIFAQSKRVQSE